MSYFGYPHYYQAPRHINSPEPQPAPAHVYPHQYYNNGQVYHTQPEPPRHYATSPAITYPFSDLEEEERAAEAYLRSIQHRREVAQAAAAHEARREAVEREVIRAARERAAAAAKRERDREVAIRAAVAAQREDVAARAAEQRAQAAAFSAYREQAIRKAVEQKEAERRAAIAATYQQQQRRKAAVYANLKAQRQAAFERQCRRNCEAEKELDGSGLEGLESLLGALFGFEKTNKNSSQVQGNATDTPAEGKPAEDTTVTSSEAPVVEPSAATSKPAATAPVAFPVQINDLLSTYLGLNVVPAESSDNSAHVPKNAENAVQHLNEFLGQFGLQFVADDDKDKKDIPAPDAAAPATASTSSFVAEPSSNVSHKSAPDERASPSLFGDVSAFPPFVRDILSNVETAFAAETGKTTTDFPDTHECGEACACNESCNTSGGCARACGNEVRRRRAHHGQDKGKNVAPGERKVRQPSSEVVAEVTTVPVSATEVPVNSTDAFLQLDTIAEQLEKLVSNFTFPARLNFASTSADSTTPSLLFNRTNSAYHAHAHALLQLILAADGITSNGDRAVRRRRKEIVSSVESALENLERQRDARWTEVKERRERGESDDEDDLAGSGVSTTGTSIAGDLEHINDVEDNSSTSPLTSTEIVIESPVENTHFIETATEDLAATEATSEVVAPEVTEVNIAPEVSDAAQNNTATESASVDPLAEALPESTELKSIDSAGVLAAGSGGGHDADNENEADTEGYELV